MIAELKSILPEYSILMSTITATGADIARKLPRIMGVIYLPIDISFIIRRILRIIKPQMLIIAETELWPNLLLEAKKMGIKIVIVNGRISEKSIHRYCRFKSLFKEPLDKINVFCMQTEMDAKRINSLGIPWNKIKVTGSAKFDLHAVIPHPKVIKQFRQSLNLIDVKDIIVAGSIREKEEEIVISAYQYVLSHMPNTTLIIVPRHLRRIEYIKNILRKKKISYSLRTKTPQPPVIILDTIGELILAYAISTIAIVGGTFTPVGGHNILEPAALGKLVLFGPYISNYQEPAKLLIACGGGIQVYSSNELAEKIISLLENPVDITKKGMSAKELVEANQGASIKNANIIKELLA
jgi:3-deoxy-D-manno-octulosonic-acid transferase